MAESGSQTLARGLTALAAIGEAEEPVTVPALAARLGIHRSMAYRLVRTLEEHGFVTRSTSGALQLGVRLVTLSRSVARDLRTVAAPELARLADELGMTAFLATHDGGEAVTLLSVEPHRADATVGQRPGSRHAIDRGAPGRVIRSQLDPERFPPERFETSRDEVLAGLSSVAVPLHSSTGAPVALSVLYLTRSVDVAAIAEALEGAARRIEHALH